MIYHKGLMIIVAIETSKYTLVTTYRSGKDLVANFGRKPTESSDIEMFEECRSVVFQELKKTEKLECDLERQVEKTEYFKWQCGRQEEDDVSFSYPQGAGSRSFRHPSNDYDPEDYDGGRPAKRQRTPSWGRYH